MMRSSTMVTALLLAGCGGAAPKSAATQERAGPTAPATPVVPVVQEPARPAPAPTETAAATADALPADVLAFRDRRDTCDHLRGEEAYDAERAAVLEKELARSCTGTDAELKSLRRRYAGNAAVLAALADYEDDVE